MPELKKEAALKATAGIVSGWTVGLGTGSTAAFAIEELGRRRREEGLDIQCVATSFQSSVLARRVGLPLLFLESVHTLDCSIDGADEIDPGMNLIKGGGAAHTQEKLVHAMSRNFIVVADHSKNVPVLGSKFSVPVEILPPALAFVEHELASMGAKEIVLRTATRKDGPVVTDNGNLVIDAKFDIQDPEGLEKELNMIPGVVENGIFAARGVAPHLAYVAHEDGVREIKRA